MITGAANRWSTGMSKNPWICALCRSIVSTRLVPAALSRLATSLAEIGYARLVLAVLPGIAVIRNHRGDARRRRPAERVDHDQHLHQVLIDRVAGRLHDEHVGAADVLVDLERDLGVGEPSQPGLPERRCRATRQISLSSCGCALPKRPSDHQSPSGIRPSPLRALLIVVGWGGRIRTFEYGIQSPAPYRLATPHHFWSRHARIHDWSVWSGQRKPLV